MDFFPVFLKLTQRPVVVIGGGDVACRKVDLLLAANADVTVVSPDLHPYLKRYVDAGKLHYKAKGYEKDDLTSAIQVWATTDDRALNHQVYHDAHSLGLWVNVVDDPDYCDYITPSMIDRSPVQIALSSGGASPVMLRLIREKLETQLPHNLSLQVDFAGRQRERIKAHYGTVDERRKFWERYFRLPQVENAKDEHALEAAFVALLDQPDAYEGAVYVIHHGSDTELLSLKALRLMQQSEHVLYPDHTDVAPFIELCRRDADRTPVRAVDLASEADKLAKQGVRVCVLTQEMTQDLQKVGENITLFAQSTDAL
ncbi:NAD(P)-dependent oxidoreductase [Thaumasiovibrio subtropicus]|uniref:NAD(P)-dependent oxidoreductase n=1 Tax=Thaumasiovibrio subtropicus TaxID=1891207 RepID=UPI000B35E400|nr:NAD(P)-dependent oxidoreductase [Thaumasiovibrio subtropicus]